MISKQILRFFGGMNKDSSLPDVQNGDTLDALNVRAISQGGETTASIESVLGNELAFDLGENVKQNKVYIMTFYTESVIVYPFNLYDQNGALLVGPLTFDNTAYIGNPSGFGTYVISTINAALGTQSATMTKVVPASTYVYVYFELTTIDYQNYSIVTDNYVTRQEAIDGTLEGRKKPIGSFDLLGDLFILSSSVTKAQGRLTITGMSNTAPSLVTTAAHGLTTGDCIAIQNSPALNGQWIVQVVNSTQFYLLGSSAPGAITASGTVITTPNGWGEIGVAQKDNSTGNWTYIPLAATRNLPFRTLYPAEVKAELDGLRKSIYWTDNNDFYRGVYYYGAYTTLGLFSQYNTEAIYTYDTIGDESKLFIPTQSPTINVNQTEGGVLLCGNWRYSVRFVVEGDIATEWSFLANPISVYPRSTSGALDGQFVTGGLATVRSTKANVINVEDIKPGLFNYIELAGLQYVGEVPIGGIVKRQQLSQEATSTAIIHYGNEVGIELDITTLNQVYSQIIKGQNLTLIDNRLVPSNYTVFTDYDLTEWAATIEYSIQRQSIASAETASNQLFRLEEYLLPSNVHQYMGYMINETYRFAIQLKWKNAGWSAPFLIDDIIFDTSGASGQRLGGLTDNSLTDAAGNTVYVPFVRFENVDLDYVLPDGTTIRSNLDNDGTPNIRFVRAECVPEVLATGMLLSAFDSPATDLSYRYINTGVALGVKDYSYFYSPDVYFTSSYPTSPTIKFLDQTQIVNIFVDAAAGPSRLAEHSAYFPSAFTDVTPISTSIVNITLGGVDLDRTNLLLFNTPALVPPLSGGRTDYGSYYAQLFEAIPNKYGFHEDTRYMTTGNAFTSTLVDTATTFDVFGGDTFTQKSFKIPRQYVELVGLNLEGRGWGLGYYSQNRVNSQMQLERVETDNNNYTFPGVNGQSTAGLLKWLRPFEILVGTAAEMEKNYNLNTNEYNLGYNINNSVQYYYGFSSLPAQSYFPTRIGWSELKTINGISDAYRIILPLNFSDLHPSDGPITHAEVWDGELITWQPRSFQRQYFNSAGQLSSSDNSEILIGNGGVMTRAADSLSKYGSNHKWGIIKGTSPGGKDTFYWINAEFKKVVRFGLDGTVVLSDIKHMQSFFANNLTFAMDYFTPTEQYGITGVFNNRFAEAIMTVRTINPDIALISVGDSAVGGTKYYGNLKWFDGTPMVYQSLSSFTVSASNYPGTIGGEDYWLLINETDNTTYNLYTIVINEYINKFTNFYSFRPQIYLAHRGGYLSPHPTKPNLVYEHDRGKYMEWYKTLESGTGTVTYTDGSTTVTGIGTSFHTELPTIKGTRYYLILGGVEYLVESVESQTSLTLEEAADSSGFGALSFNRVNSEDGYAQVVVNDVPDAVKGYNALRVNSKNKPSYTEFKTDRHTSFLEEADYEEYEGYFEAAIKNDSTESAENPTGLNDIDTSRLWGTYMKAKIFFKKREFNKLFDIIVKFVPKARLYTK